MGRRHGTRHGQPAAVPGLLLHRRRVASLLYLQRRHDLRRQITPVGGAAKSVPEYWAKYKENRVDPFLQRLLATTSVVANWDDHEMTNDFRGPTEPLMPLGNRAFHDYWPLSVGPERIYRSLRWGRELEVFVLDTRQYADPLEAPDGPAKTMLGEAQRAWLESGVAESDARWKVLVTSSPLSIIRSDDLHQDDWGPTSTSWALCCRAGGRPE